MPWRKVLAAVCAVLAVGGSAPSALRGQTAASSDSPQTLKVHSDLVVLHVSVHPRGSKPPGELTAGDFSVSEDSVPQTIAFFSHEDLPVTVGLVIDTSSSLGGRRADLVIAGQTFARASHRDDEIFTVDFSDHARLGLPPGLDFTSDIAVLTRALEGVHGRGRTALYDAVMLALGHVERGTNDSRYLVILSDGADNASRATFDDVVHAAARSDVVIYAVGLFNREDRDRNPGVLKRLSRLTGGQAFFPSTGERLIQAMETIARDIRNGYTLTYVPTDTVRDGRYRTVSVELQPRLRDTLTLRTRRGYLAPSDSGSSP